MADPTHQELFEARRLIADLRAPDARIFWADLVLTASITWGSVAVATSTSSSLVAVLATLLAGMALTRAILFVHEITHLRKGSLPGFRLAWNVLVGIPVLAPSFIYETVHVDHHKVNVYRTEGDPEHAPDEKGLLMRCLAALGGAALLPTVLFVRWLVLAPLSLGSPALRQWVERYLSALSTNLRYRATNMKPAQRREAHAAEAAAFLWALTVVMLAASGVLPIRAIAVTMAAMSFAMAVTDLRGEILHRFSDEGSFGTLSRQVRDSVNIPHTGIASRVLMPLGIAYHALHHLDMTIPYHNLPKAHARLMKHLPADSIYVRSTVDGLVSATRNAIADDAAHQAADSAAIAAA